VRREGGHVIYAEPIPVGGRVRDLAEGSDGRVVLVYDDSGNIGLLGR